MSKVILLFYMLTGAVFAAQQNFARYEQLQQQYQHFAENDAAALPLVRHSISVAKKNRNYRHLNFAYEDAVFYSPAKTQKLHFADSAIVAASQIREKAWTSRAHLGRGVVWYFNFRNYNKALEDYLMAARFAAGTGDLYLINRIKYQIGVVKYYLGYHEEALQYFKECNQYFRRNLNAAAHPDLIYNFTRGYLNTAHQMSLCYRRLERWPQVDSLLKQTPFNREKFKQEHAYFQKEYGIAAFHRGDFSLALDSLRAAAQLIRGKKDEGNLSTAYYYLGAASMKSGDEPAGRAYLQKVDSLFAINKMVSPDVRAALEHLLRDTDIRHEPERATYLMSQLLKADSILNRDLPHLSARLYREYDTAKLQTEKQRLEQLQHLNRYVVLLSLSITAVLFVALWLLHLRRRRVTEKQKQVPEASPERQNDYADDIVLPILQKLKEFEQKEQYTDPDLTLGELAKKVGTNAHRLSYVLNEHHGVNFNTYLARLRIAYITQMVDTDPKFRNYTVESLAKACGIRSRQHFSRLFQKINGVRPSEYAHQRRQQVNPVH